MSRWAFCRTLAPRAQEDGAGPGLQEIVVTGSRIAKTDLVTSSPVIRVDSEELLFQGTVRVEDLLRTLPQLYVRQGAGQSNGATGTATVDLRNPGTRTHADLDKRASHAGGVALAGRHRRRYKPGPGGLDRER